MPTNLKAGEHADGRTVAPEATAQETPAAAVAEADSDQPLIMEDLLVEDVSIDGMCGVY